MVCNLNVSTPFPTPMKNLGARLSANMAVYRFHGARLFERTA
jgi:hypothetical protein